MDTNGHLRVSESFFLHEKPAPGSAPRLGIEMPDQRLKRRKPPACDPFKEACATFALLQRFGLDINLTRRFREIFEERWAKPALHGKLFAVIPIPAGLLTPPFQFQSITGKWHCAEDGAKSALRVRNIGDNFIYHRVDAGDKRFLFQADGWIIEDPSALVFVRHDDE